jgi:hypothetical protein
MCYQMSTEPTGRTGCDATEGWTPPQLYSVTLSPERDRSGDASGGPRVREPIQAGSLSPKQASYDVYSRRIRRLSIWKTASTREISRVDMRYTAGT